MAVWKRDRQKVKRELLYKQRWMPWTRSTVWDALVQPYTLAYWAHLRFCSNAQGRPLEAGDVLLWERETPLFPSWHLLQVEHIVPSHAIRFSIQAGKYRGTVEIRLEPEEGGEITRIEVSVVVPSTHVRWQSWFHLFLLKLALGLSIMRALQRVDALLESQQEQAERGKNAAYTYWRRAQAERALRQQQIITDIWRLRY